jgi:hypothetical protein
MTAQSNEQAEGPREVSVELYWWRRIFTRNENWWWLLVLVIFSVSLLFTVQNRQYYMPGQITEQNKESHLKGGHMTVIHPRRIVVGQPYHIDFLFTPPVDAPEDVKSYQFLLDTNWSGETNIPDKIEYVLACPDCMPEKKHAAESPDHSDPTQFIVMLEGKDKYTAPLILNLPDPQNSMLELMIKSPQIGGLVRFYKINIPVNNPNNKMNIAVIALLGSFGLILLKTLAPVIQFLFKKITDL